jgi:citrate lyase subunit beta/citryl-CoA lyase
MLSVPGHLDDLVVKGANSGADVVMLDLQDAVPPAKKIEARGIVRRALVSGLFEQKRVFVRVNHPETGLTQGDVDEVACEQLNGFVYPMANNSAEILEIDSTLHRKEGALGLPSHHFSLIVLIETPLGVINAYPMAVASKRVVALQFGAEDFLVMMRAQHDPDQVSLHTPRAQIAISARAAGIQALDTPFLDLGDPDGLRQHSERGRKLGMSGMLVISPRQTKTANEVYSPSDEEVARARELVELAEETRAAGHSYALNNGQLVSPSVEKEAKATLERALTIQRGV